MRTPVSDPDVDARVTGKIDLADVRRTVKLEGIDQLAGTVAADAAVRTRMSYIDKKQYDKVGASGTRGRGQPHGEGPDPAHPLTIQQASLALAPQRAQLKSFSGTIGSSDLQASGTIENLLAFAHARRHPRGNATVRSNRFNLDEWQSGEGDLQIIPVPPKIDFGLDATVAELTYDKLKMSNARGRLRVKDQRVTLENFRMNTLGGEIGVTGFYETTDPAKPTFDVGLKMTKLDIPSAFNAFTTVQMLAPVAKYAVGNVTTDLRVNGALGKNMMPLFPGLSGGGTLQTSQLVLKNFPPLEKMVDVTKLQFLDNPTLQALTRGVPDPRRPALRAAVRREARRDDHERERLQRARPVAPVHPGPQGAALHDGWRGQQAIAGLVSKAGAAGRRSQRRARDPARHQARRHGDQSHGHGRREQPRLVGEEGRGAGGEQAVDREGGLGGGAAGAGGGAEGGVDPPGRPGAGGQGEEGRATAGRLAHGQGVGPARAKLAAKPAADALRKQSDAKAAGIVGEANKRADELVAEAKRKAGQK